ncbi:MAG: hypothetical protein ABSC22_08670 [Roseiarcus sp.]|jgi:hypothetical protein
MWKVAALFWVFIAPVVAGVLVLAVLMAPALQMEAGKWIAIAAILGFVVAIPVAWAVARMNARSAA